MALSVVKRPIGFIISTTSASATYTNNSSTLTKAAHGLSTGNFIYVSSGQQIGFWNVTVLSASTFTISEYSGATAKVFAGVGSITYYTVTDSNGHGYNAVHLPIVYKLQSTLWPTNSVDTIRTVSSFSNDNGYTKLTLSGALKSDVTELEFVKITGPQAGIYQILSWFSSSVVTINLAYNSAYTWGTVQYYYRNYTARIRVYAGIKSTHYFAAQKPYALITEQNITPDSNGIVQLNINEYLKDKIEVLANNINLGTLPNNIDAWCNFYISYAEAYDFSAGGYGLMDYVGPYTQDSFEGIAVNAELPFKNIYSGSMSRYFTDINTVSGVVTQGTWLTPSLYPRLTAGQYFDISFLNNFGNNIILLKTYYLAGLFVGSENTPVADYGIGVYRLPIVQLFSADRVDIQLEWDDYSGDYTIFQPFTIEINTHCASNQINLSWLNNLGGFDYWTFQGFADYGINIKDTKETVKNIMPNWPNSIGADADTIRQETQRKSNQTIVCRAENLTADQVDDLYKIKTSPAVFIVNSATDRKRVILDKSSFIYHPQANKLFDITFTMEPTEDLPSQDL